MKERNILYSIILVSLLIFQVGGTSNFQNDTNLNEQVFSVSDSSYPIYHSGEVDTPFSITLNVTSERLLVQFDIETPCVLSYEFSLEGISAPSTVGFDSDIFESERQYIPQLDKYSYGSRLFYSTIAVLSTGTTLGTDGMVYATESGFLIFDFTPTWGDSTDEIKIDIDVTQQFPLSSSTDIEIGDDATLYPVVNNTWDALHFSIDDASLFNISLTSIFDYDTPAYWSGGTIFPIRCTLLDVQHGYTGKWSAHSIGFTLPSGANIGSITWTDYDVMRLPQGEYYLIMGANEFDNLGQVNLTFNVENIETVSLSSNELLELEFDDASINEFILEVSPEYYNLNDLTFDITGGANWSVKALKWASSTAIFSAECYQDPLTHYVNELRYIDFILLDSLIGLESSYSSPALTGDLYRDSVLTYGHWYDDDNGTIQLLDPITNVKNKFPTFYFTVIAEPIDSIHSESFNVSLSLDSEPIPDISKGTTQLEFNLTSGPSNFFYKVPVERGTIIGARITPAGYGVLEQVFIQIYPDVQTKNNWQVVYEPYFSWGHNIDTYPFRASNFNDYAEIRVMAISDGYMIINPYSYASYPSDLTKAQLDITITDPIDYEIGDTISTELDYESPVAYKFDVIEDALYEYNVELSGFESSSIFTNSDGHSPFHQSGFEPYTYVSSSSSMRQTNLYSGKENETGILAFIGDGLIEFSINALVVESVATTVIEYVNNTIYVDSNSTEYDIGYTDGRNFGIMIVGAGFAGFVIVVLFLRRR